MELADEFEGLIQSARGLLTANEASEVRELVDARQYAMALEALWAPLIDKNKHIPADLYSRIHSLGQQLDGVDPYIIERGEGDRPPLT
ncbi:MAG: hypothetical protein M3R21_01700 [Candidatus Dormibacteraeota bacterium]|nr:hypothetical protein [Candidatus Dormibacteraeota bacterium]